MSSLSGRYGSVCTEAFGICFLLLLAYIIRQKFFHPLRKFRGPFLASCTDIWRGYAMFRGHIEQDMRNLHNKYGPIVRVGPNSLSISHPDVTKVIWGEGSKITKSPFYDGFTAVRPNSFGMRDEKLHAKRRRTLAHTFSRENILGMESVMDRSMAKLRRALDQHAVSGELFDLQLWMKLWVFDVLAVLLFNKDFGGLDTGDPAKLPLTNEHIRIALASGLVPWTIKYVKWLPKIPVAAVQKLYRGRQILVNMARNCVADLLQNKDQENSLLRVLISARDPETGNVLDMEDVRSEAFGFLNAGSSTTSSTLTGLLWHLFSNPAKLSKLVAELDESLSLAIEPESVYSIENCSGLPYLNACHKEGARIYPVFGIPLPRIVPPEGRVIGGDLIPGGTEAMIWAYTLNNEEKIWGADISEFTPERWLGPAASRLNRYWIPFGLGHRGCLGKNLAEAEIFKIMATLLRNYEFQMLQPQQGKSFKDCVRNVGSVKLTGSLLVSVKQRWKTDAAD